MSLVEKRKSNEPVIVETVILRFEEDVACVSPRCPYKNIISKGEDALQSPNFKGFYYHVDCFRDLIAKTGRDPGAYFKIVDANQPPEN